MHQVLSDSLHIVAYTAIVLFCHKVYKAIYRVFYVYFLATPKDLKALAGRDATWAVVTGSSDGIGRSYAVSLADKGFDLILISRTLEKLEKVRQTVLSLHPERSVKLIQFDFARSTYQDYERLIFPVLDGHKIGVLVNNAGQMHRYPEVHDQFPGGLLPIYDQSVLNTAPVALLTGKVLPQMLERRAGVVINLSSAAAYFEMEKWALYSATKRFVKHFGACLQKEYAGRGLTIQTVCPMFVATNMCHYASGNTVYSPDDYVKSALRTVGLADETAGCFWHEIQLLGFAFPAHFVDPFVRKLSADQKAEYLAKHKNKLE